MFIQHIKLVMPHAELEITDVSDSYLSGALSVNYPQENVIKGSVGTDEAFHLVFIFQKCQSIPSNTSLCMVLAVLQCNEAVHMDLV